MTIVLQAYRFALDPTTAQEGALRSHCGGQRYAYNWGLARVKANLEQRAAEATYGIAEKDLTPWLNWSAYSLRRDWNQAKAEVAPWWGENSKEAYSSGLANLASALGNWNTSKSGTRSGSKIRFPKFKGKRAVSSCRHVERGTARIRSATITWQGGRCSARSPWKSTATTPPHPDRTRLSAWISGSSPWRCSRPVR